MAKSFYLKYEVSAKTFDQYPLQWENIFGRKAPLGIEIGFGNGDFLIDWSIHQPDWNLVGIELSLESMQRIQRRIYRDEISNIRLVHDHAGFALRELFPNDSVQRIIMNFPDPWPKKRHERRRLLNPEFVAVLSAILTEDGIYELVTDQEWYAYQARELLEENQLFAIERVEKNPERAVTTKYERKWRSLGRDIFRIQARKISSASVKRILGDITMPHVIVRRKFSENDLNLLVGREFQEEDSFFKIKSIFKSLDNQSYLLRVVSTDIDYTQMFYIIVAPHGENRIVKLDPTIQPYRTPAVKMAVWKTGRMLETGVFED